MSVHGAVEFNGGRLKNEVPMRASRHFLENQQEHKMSRKNELAKKLRETETAFIAARNSYDPAEPCDKRAGKLETLAQTAKAYADALREWESFAFMMDTAWA